LPRRLLKLPKGLLQPRKLPRKPSKNQAMNQVKRNQMDKKAKPQLVIRKKAAQNPNQKARRAMMTRSERS